jgi:hypothetical protein
MNDDGVFHKIQAMYFLMANGARDIFMLCDTDVIAQTLHRVGTQYHRLLTLCVLFVDPQSSMAAATGLKIDLYDFLESQNLA